MVIWVSIPSEIQPLRAYFSITQHPSSVNPRSYIRYYDANGKLRVFYNVYKKNLNHGGCMCSFKTVASNQIDEKEEETTAPANP